MQPRKVIECVECGGSAHLLIEYRRDEEPEPGGVVPYRCADCGERWDIVLEAEDDQDFPAAAGPDHL